MTGKDLFTAFLEMLAENRTNLTFSVFSAVSKFLWITLRSKRKGNLKERLISFCLAVIVGCVAGAIADSFFSKGFAHLIIAVSSIASDSIIEYIMLKVTAKEIESDIDKIKDKFLK